MFAQTWKNTPFLGFFCFKQHPCTKKITSQQAQASHLAGHVTVSRSAWNSMAQFVADNGNALTPDGQIHRRNLVSLSDLAVRS